METIFGLWYRDAIKFFRDKFTIVSSFALPFLFLVVFGTGMGGAIESLLLGANASQELSEFNFVKFMFPGIIAMAVFTTTMFAGYSLIEDRQAGYLKEVLVSPASRVLVAIGKILGCATTALLQGIMMLVFVPFIGLSLNAELVVKLALSILLISFTLSAVSILLASFLKSIQGFQMIVQVVLYPLFFLSGAFFPLNGIPKWMEIIVKINPMTYIVDFLKRIVLDVDNLNPILKQAMGMNLEVLNHKVTSMDEIILLVVLGIIFTIVTAISFSKVD
ncbi:ABC transporter permease [Ruminiclostridium josui]|uniref:ABC transporter permease n=1 Tax=Ruminiclostridium josui TaxID=1499 RepID=UPI0004645060|nr:ABC transporter permease [Ruminiclostridium josui]